MTMPEQRATSSRIRAAATMLRIAWQADPRGSMFALGLLTLESLVQSSFALWLKLLIDGSQAGAAVRVSLAACGMAASIVGSIGLAYFGKRIRRTLTERAQYLIERRMIELVGRTPTLEIHETPEHLTQLELLEDESWEFGQVVPALIDVFATIANVVTTTLLLLSVHPLLLLLPLFGLPALLVSAKTGNLFRLGGERAAEPSRRANYLFELATTSGPAKEIRQFRLGSEIMSRFHHSHKEIQRIHWQVNLQGALIGLATRMVFLVGFFGAIVFVVDRAVEGRATSGDAVLTAVLAGQVLGLVAGSATLLQWAWRTLTAAARYVYLEDVSRRALGQVDHATSAPRTFTDGIRLEGVAYRYPLGTHDVLHDINLHLPAGSTIAIVGDNGAGKTTLVKLLAGLYRPTEGRIMLDDVNLSRLDPEQWRLRVSAGFQDHARWEFVVRETVGIGDLGALKDDTIVTAAIERAGASDLLQSFPARLDTQLGPNWPHGIDLSGGQWQKLAIARAMMRTDPLLLLLDEPTAALDADTEHLLFERWTVAAEQLRRRSGAVTVLVSHRFSTVQMADLIVVLDQGHIAEVGSHAELVTRGGLYAELFAIQAQSYR